MIVLTQTELLHDLLKEEDRPICIKYVFNFKLTTQVRSVLGRSNRTTIFIELKKGLQGGYPNQRTLQQVLSELRSTKQQAHLKYLICRTPLGKHKTLFIKSVTPYPSIPTDFVK